MAESASMAFLLVLEALSPVERGVVLLREVFEYPYEEIAEIVGKGEQNPGEAPAPRPRFGLPDRAAAAAAGGGVVGKDAGGRGLSGCGRVRDAEDGRCRRGRRRAGSYPRPPRARPPQMADRRGRRPAPAGR
jgi:hypothetical protein